MKTYKGNGTGKPMLQAQAFARWRPDQRHNLPAQPVANTHVSYCRRSAPSQPRLPAHASGDELARPAFVTPALDLIEHVVGALRDSEPVRSRSLFSPVNLRGEQPAETPAASATLARQKLRGAAIATSGARRTGQGRTR